LHRFGRVKSIPAIARAFRARLDQIFSTGKCIRELERAAFRGARDAIANLHARGAAAVSEMGRKSLFDAGFCFMRSFSAATMTSAAPTWLDALAARDHRSTVNRSSRAIARKIRFFFVVL